LKHTAEKVLQNSAVTFLASCFVMAGSPALFGDKKMLLLFEKSTWIFSNSDAVMEVAVKILPPAKGQELVRQNISFIREPMSHNPVIAHTFVTSPRSWGHEIAIKVVTDTDKETLKNPFPDEPV